MATFAEKVSLAKQQRKHQKNLIEKLAKINETNKDLEKKNLNFDKDFLSEIQRQVDRKLELD